MLRIPHREATGATPARPSILPRISLCLSLASLLVSLAALAVAVNPELLHDLADRAAAWSTPPPPNPDAEAARARLGRRKQAELDRRKALVEALGRERAKSQAQEPQPPQPPDGMTGR